MNYFIIFLLVLCATLVALFILMLYKCPFPKRIPSGRDVADERLVREMSDQDLSIGTSVLFDELEDHWSPSKAHLYNIMTDEIKRRKKS